MKEMDKISKLLEETQNLLEGFSSGSLSPVSSYYNSDSEQQPNEEELGVVEEFKVLLRSGDNSKICKFIEAWEQQLKGALHIAVEEKCKDLEVFKSLLRAGCDPLELDSNQRTALTLLLEQNEQEADTIFGDDCTISTLLGEWELRRAATRDSKVFRLIHARSWKELYSFLLTTADPVKMLCKPDAKYAGISPIHEIAALNDVATMKKLTRKFKEIDFNVKAIGSGNTPLHEATHMTSAEMVSFLLENGAKCDVKNAAGKIPAHLGTEKIQVIIEIKNMTMSNEEIKPPQSSLSAKKSADLFVKATKSASSDSLSREERKMKQIIGFLDQIEKHETEDEGESFDSDNEDDSITNVHNCTSVNSSNNHNNNDHDNFDVESVLQREGHSGRTILHRFARRNQSEKLMKFLKEHDFDEVKCKSLKLFEVIDNSGSTPLHDAAAEGSLEAAKIFLFGSKAAKAKNLLIDPSIPAAITGDTPLHAAASSGNAEIVELLLAVGANREAANIEGKRAIDVTRSKSVKKLLNPSETKIKKEGDGVVGDTQVASNTSSSTSSTNIAASKGNHHNMNAVNVAVNDVPVKRGPGRPRKYPRPDEPAAKIAKTEKAEPKNELILLSPPLLPQLKNFSFTEIEKDSCVILVRFKEEWLMLYDQFLKVLSSFAKEDLNHEDFIIDPCSADRLSLSSLPKTGNLILDLQARDQLKFISKSKAMQILEKEFRVHLTGPFGYIDIPRINKNNSLLNSVVGGCPLKLKLKLEKQEHLLPPQSCTNWLIGARNQNFEEQKSPKSFHM